MRSVRPLLFLGVLVVGALGLWLLFRGRADRPPEAKQTGVLVAREQQVGAPILLGRGGDVDPKEKWWLTVSVVEAPGGEPVADAPLTFVLWLVALPGMRIPLERTTDADGNVRIGPILAPFAREELAVGVLPGRYELAKQVAHAVPDPSRERELRATCHVLRNSRVSGRVDLPRGVRPEDVRVWHVLAPRLWKPVALDAGGRFSARTYGSEPVLLEAAALSGGERWYGRTTTTPDGPDVTLALSALRPGDPALLHVRLAGPAGRPVTADVSRTIVVPMLGTSSLSPVRVEGSALLAIAFDPSGTITLQARGIDPTSLGSAEATGIPMDQTEVTLTLPRSADPAAQAVGPPRVMRSHEDDLRPTLPGASPVGVRVRVDDWRFADRGVWACLVEGRRILSQRRLDAAGTAHLPAPGRLTDLQVWIAGLSGDRYVWAQDLDPDAEALRVEPQVGGTVQGTIAIPDGLDSEPWFVLAPGPAMAALSLDVGGFPVRYEGSTFEVRGVPPGAWEFTLFYRVDGEYRTLDFEARAGEVLRVDVPAK